MYRLSVYRPWLLGLGLLLNATPLIAVQEIATDVCVYGGTSGGVIAAVQAARMGKSVALVVVNNHLGGMTSGGLGQTDIGSFGDSYIQGVAREFYSRVGQKYGTGAKFTFEPHVAEAVFNEMVAQAGVMVYTNQYLLSVAMQGPQLVALTMNNGNLFRAGIFIDASYEGDLMAKAGVSYTLGREATSQYGESYNGIRAPNTGGHQFGSLNVNPYVVTNNPASGLLPLIQGGSPGTAGSADQRMQAYNFRMCLTTAAANQLPLNAPTNYAASQYELLGRYIQALVARGTTPTLGTFMNIGGMPNSKTDINNNGPVSTDFIGQALSYPEADYATRAQIWQAHKNYLQGLLYFLATDPRVPAGVQSQMQSYRFCKDEFADNGGWPYQLYEREARRMVSDYVMIQSNCLGQAVAPDSIGLAAYTMDSHNCQRVAVSGYAQNEGDTQIGSAAPYPISYRSIIPKARECTNLLVPWCLSASHIGFGSIRMEPVFMILGQSAGTAACLAIDDGVAVQQVNVAKLQAQLGAGNQLLQWGSSATGLIVDNADTTGVTIVGPWTGSSSISGYYGANYLTDGNTNKGLSSLTHAPTLPQSDTYQVYARWTANPNRATNVPIDIIHPAGTNTVYVDQTQQNGQWVLLLITNFAAGTAGKVRIRNTGTTAYVIADAVQFVSTTYIPTVNLWATDALASKLGPRAGSITLSRAGNTNTPLTVNLTFGGSASNGVDYASFPNSILLSAGVLTTNLSVVPLPSSLPTGSRTATISLATNGGYSVGSLNFASINIEDDPLNSWRLHWFGTNATNPAIAGDAASPAGDGIRNLVKYALGLDPTQPTNSTARTMSMINSNDCFEFSYTRPDPPPLDIIYQVQSSNDLVVWCTNACVLTKQIVLNPDNTATVTCTSQLPVRVSSKEFLRLQVSSTVIPKAIQGAKVVAFGDSITYGYGVPSSSNWVNQLQTRFGLKMVNAGISGDTSSQGLARLQTDVLAQHPDFVIINFGMNDHVMTGLNQPQVSQSTFRNNLISMIDQIRIANAVPVLVTVNYIIEGDSAQYYYNRHPATYYANVGGAQAWLDSYIQILRTVAAEKSVNLVDVRAACDNYNRYDFLRSLLNAANTDDGVHPHLIGSSLYAQLIGDYLAARY